MVEQTKNQKCSFLLCSFDNQCIIMTYPPFSFISLSADFNSWLSSIPAGIRVEKKISSLLSPGSPTIRGDRKSFKQLNGFMKQKPET